MGDSVEELDSLFDYSRVQPDVVSLDDDDDDEDEDAALALKRQKNSLSSMQKEDEKGKGKVVEVVEEEEEDWLALPPELLLKASKPQLEENPTLKELRLIRQELQSVAKSAEDFLQEIDKPVEKEDSGCQLPSGDSTTAKPSVPPCERPKIVLSIQDKDGIKQFRVFADEKFERLFKLYSDKVNLSPSSLVFSFDGDKVSPTATPQSLDMEDNDIIEVRAK